MIRRVLHCSDRHDPKLGGVSAVLDNLVRASEGGYRIVTKRDFTVFRADSVVRWANCAVWPLKLLMFLWRYKPCVIHNHGLWLPFNFFVSFYGWASRTPVLVHPHGMLSKECLKKNQFLKLLLLHTVERFRCKSAASIICSSSREYDEVCAFFSEDLIQVVPNPIDSVHEDGISREKLVVSLSRLVRGKRLEFLIEAWAQSALDGWTLYICGDGDPAYEDFLREKVSLLDCDETIQFKGFCDVDRKKEILCRARLFVSASISENFGMSIAEALAFGVPCLLCEGTPWDEFEHSEAISIVNDENYASELASLLKMLADGPCVEDVSQQAKRVVAPFASKNVVATYEKLYCDLIGKES